MSWRDLLSQAVNDILHRLLALLGFGRSFGSGNRRRGGPLPLDFAIDIVKVIPACIVRGDVPALGQIAGQLPWWTLAIEETDVPLRYLIARARRNV